MSDPKHRLQRILTLIPYLRKNPGISLAELEAFSGAPASELVDDLNRILLCGVPPYLPDDYIGVYVDEGRVEIRFADHFRRPVRFTLPEALALKLAIESLPVGGDLSYREARRSLLEKIGRILGREAAQAGGGSRREAERLIDGRLAASPGRGPTQGLPPPRRRNEEVLGTLLPAIEERRAVEIEYYSASSDALRTRTVHPFGLVEKSGEQYLVAHCCLTGETRSFRVDRIRRARSTDVFFEVPPGFSLERFERRQMDFARHFDVTARVRFSRSVARYVREARKGEPMRETAQGDLIVTMRAASVPWLLKEILGYGPEAEILSPPEVRRAMRDFLAERIAALAEAK